MKRLLLITALISYLVNPVAGQDYFRIRAGFSVKSAGTFDQKNLTVGEVTYDRNSGQIIYHIDFPEKEQWITADTLIYRVKENRLISKMFTPAMAQFSVFHLSLNSHLQDFGLKSSQYTLKEVSREGEMVISTWSPPSNLSDKLGDILVSTIDKRLYGVVFQDTEGEVIRKQFFSDYEIVSGLAFPGIITEIYYTGDDESYQVTTFRNIRIDELENDQFYHYPVRNLR